MRIPALAPEAIASDAWSRVAAQQQAELARPAIDVEAVPIAADDESPLNGP